MQLQPRVFRHILTSDLVQVMSATWVVHDRSNSWTQMMVTPKDPGYNSNIFSKSPCMAILQEASTDGTLCWTSACL